MPDYINSMFNEIFELNGRIYRLDKYYNRNMDNMSGIEAYLMKKQRKAMAEYRNALRKRIEFYKGKEGIK